MIGTIKRLNSSGSTGVIAAADGLVFGFLPSAVLAYDVPSLAVGQAVSFDLEDGRRPRAVNVCVQHAPGPLEGQKKRLEITRLRYVGFQQVGEIRSYRFELFAPGEARATFIVNSDMALFKRHHVGLQEGPGICLHLLAECLALDGVTGETPVQCSLTDREMLACLAARPVPRAKGGSKRDQPATGGDSNLTS